MTKHTLKILRCEQGKTKVRLDKDKDKVQWVMQLEGIIVIKRFTIRTLSWSLKFAVLNKCQE